MKNYNVPQTVPDKRSRLEKVKFDVIRNPIFDESSFVTDEEFTQEEEWKEIGKSWMDLLPEDNKFVMEVAVEEELEAIEKDTSEGEDLDEDEIIVKKVDHERKPPTTPLLVLRL